MATTSRKFAERTKDLDAYRRVVDARLRALLHRIADDRAAGSSEQSRSASVLWKRQERPDR